MDMNNNKRRRSMILYFIIAIMLLFALNQTFNTFMQPQINKVSYSEFLSMVDQNKVKNVDLNTGTGVIRFTDGDPNNKDTKYYEATAFPNDDQLVENLRKHEVNFKAEIPDTNSSLWIYMLVSYGIPIPYGKSTPSA